MAEVNDKIRFLRLFKDWSQEEMAKNLHMTTKGYAKIERGEVDITISKLKQISKALGVELKELIGLDDKNVFNFIENCQSSIQAQSNNGVFELGECKHELEKAQLLLEQKDKEIAYLKEIIELMRKESSS
jgi:transcriptional regulator with XRE-family HTH domain